MLLKGTISAVNIVDNTAEVTLLEFDNAVTAPLKGYNRIFSTQDIGSFAVVAVFGADYNDGVVL